MLKNLYGEKRTARTQQELNAILLSHERYATYRGGSRAQLAHARLDGLILANRNLTEADFSGASLVRANLYGSNLERASLYCADLRDCNLQSAKLARADLRGASFRGARLAYATMDNADLRAAMMMYVGEDGVSVVNSERGDREPSTVDFSNCSLKNASFGNAKLDGANFSGAVLTGANFKNAKLTNASFKGAVLTGVNLKDLAVPPEALAGSIMDVTPEAASKFDQLKARLDAHQQWISSGGSQGAQGVFDGEDLRPLRDLLVGRPLTGLSLRNAICIGLDFSGSQLQAAKFVGADLRDANFSNADLRGASLRGTKLAHATFEKTNLGSLPLTNGSAMAPDLTGAEATVEQFYRATLEDTVTALGLAPTNQPPVPPSD